MKVSRRMLENARRRRRTCWRWSSSMLLLLLLMLLWSLQQSRPAAVHHRPFHARRRRRAEHHYHSRWRWAIVIGLLRGLMIDSREAHRHATFPNLFDRFSLYLVSRFSWPVKSVFPDNAFPRRALTPFNNRPTIDAGGIAFSGRSPVVRYDAIKPTAYLEDGFEWNPPPIFTIWVEVRGQKSRFHRPNAL